MEPRLLCTLQGYTAIIHAAAKGFKDIVELLITAGAEVNAEVSLNL